MTDDKTLEAVARALWVRRFGKRLEPVFNVTFARGRGDTGESQAMLDGVMSDARAALQVVEACGYVHVPEGFVTVPREPTAEMIESAYDSRYIRMTAAGAIGNKDAVFVFTPECDYRAMLSAAPAPPKGDVA